MFKSKRWMFSEYFFKTFSLHYPNLSAMAESGIISRIIFLYLLSTAFGRFPQYDKPINPVYRLPVSRSDIPKDVYEYLGDRPLLRGTDDFIKLPKELLEKWFAHTPSSSTDLPETTTPNVIENKMPNDEKDEFEIDEKDAKVKNISDNDKESSGIQNYAKHYFDNFNVRGNSETAVKHKLFGLISDTKASIDRKTSPVQTVHDAYKMNRLYKIGYLVSNINRTQESLTDFYKHVEKNIKSWDIMKTLNAYDQVKTADEFLSKALYILNLVGSPSNKKLLPNRLKLNNLKHRNATHNFGLGASEEATRLAWSYYDGIP